MEPGWTAHLRTPQPDLHLGLHSSWLSKPVRPKANGLVLLTAARRRNTRSEVASPAVQPPPRQAVAVRWYLAIPDGPRANPEVGDQFDFIFGLPTIGGGFCKMATASQRIFIESLPNFVQQEVALRGWVCRMRVLGKTTFVVL
jgi:hypothetical protein